MKSIWKWVLGILLVLVVIGLLVGSAFLLHGFGRGGIEAREFQGYGQFQRGPMMGEGQVFGFGGGPGRMMGGYGFGLPLIGICLFFLRGLIPLALLALVVYGAYRMGKHRTSAPDRNAVASTNLAAPATAAGETSAVKTCRKCGSVVQDEWRNCPICGTKQ